MARSHIVVLITVGLFVLGQLTAAQARSPSATSGNQAIVSFGDINIHSEQGAQVLLGRLRAAARLVCGPEPILLNLSGRQSYNACRKSALDDAVAAIDSPKLNEAYRGNSDNTRIAQN